jgi:hypothetical protein
MAITMPVGYTITNQYSYRCIMRKPIAGGLLGVIEELREEGC